MANSSLNNIAIKVRVYDELYEKMALEAAQLHLTIGEYTRRVLEDRHRILTLPPAAKPVAMNAAKREGSEMRVHAAMSDNPFGGPPTRTVALETLMGRSR